MSVEHFLDNTIVVSRLRVISGNKRGYVTTATAETHIQEANLQTRQTLGIVEDRLWTAYFSVDGDYEPQKGDKIVDSNGVMYKVIEVTKKDYAFAINQHIEVLMTEYNE